MRLADIKLSVKEVLMISAIVFALGGGTVTLKMLATGVSELNQTVSILADKVSELKFEQERINLIVNFLYGEGFKAGWVPTQYDMREWEKHMRAEAKK